MSRPTPSHDPVDWFTLIFGVLIGAIVGGMLGLSFAPSLVTFA